MGTVRQSRGPSRPARKPAQERALATVEAILEAAARILEREGLTRSFGTNRIAREAGVGIGSLYEYFEGKDAIVKALCERHIGRVRSLIDRAFVELRDVPLEQAVEAFIDALFGLHEARPALQRTLHAEFPQRFGLEPFIESDRYLEQKLVEWLAPRYPEAGPELLAARAFVAIRGARSVIIHSVIEGLPEERRRTVRATLKTSLMGTLAGG